MRVLVATAGSDGDVRPTFALAKELRERGHEVLVGAPDLFAKSAAELGLPFTTIGPHWLGPEHAEVFLRCLAEPNPLKQLAIMMEDMAPAQRAMVPRLMELVPQCDVVVHPTILVAAAAAARARQVPHVSIQYVPIQRGRDHGPTGHDFGPLFNRALWSLGAWLLRRATDATLNTIVAAAGLPPWRDVLAEACVSARLDLVAVSPTIVPRDSAWPASRHVSGYLLLDEPLFTPDPALAAWVESEPPVVIGFGSMMGFDAPAVTQTILDAVRDLPRKVVLQSGWAGLGGVQAGRGARRLATCLPAP